MSEGAVKLVRMVNQIARFFDTQPGDPAAHTVQHLKSYWAPSMLCELVALSNDVAEGLSPTARAAALKVKAVLGASTPADIHVQDPASASR